MLNFDIQNHKPLREMVYEELKMQILTGAIVPGTRMMEVELAKEIGVSRTPIREAIRKLEKEGLVTIEPRRGAYASQISTSDMVEILAAVLELLHPVFHVLLKFFFFHTSPFGRRVTANSPWAAWQSSTSCFGCGQTPWSCHGSLNQ